VLTEVLDFIAESSTHAHFAGRPADGEATVLLLPLAAWRDMDEEQQVTVVVQPVRSAP